MATVTITPAAGSSNNPDKQAITPLMLRSRRIDFAEAYAKKGSNLAASDVIEALTINAGELVVGCIAQVITAAGAAMTATVGDATDPDGFITSVTLNGTAGTVTTTPGAYFQSGTTPFAVTQGKYYSAADTLDLVLGGTASNSGVVEITMLYYSLNS